jgi:hypothetical protein
MIEAEDTDVVSKIEIVDVFTRLIFGEDGPFTCHEEDIIQALRDIDQDMADLNLVQMGRQLRILGVSEMITMVARVRRELDRQTPAGADPGNRVAGNFRLQLPC